MYHAHVYTKNVPNISASALSPAYDISVKCTVLVMNN